MTTADRLRAEGEARGEARGRTKGRAEALIELLTLEFGSLPADTVAAVHGADPALLRTWTARVLTANTVDEVFRRD